MSINHNCLSLECPSHFSNNAAALDIQPCGISKSWRLLGTSLCCATQPTKTLSEYSFNATIFDRDLNYFDFFISEVNNFTQVLGYAKEISNIHTDDLYDRKNLLEFVRLMNEGNSKIGHAMGYTSHIGMIFWKMKQLNLWECDCDYSKRFPRDDLQSIRNSFEGELTRLIERQFKNLKDHTLNFLFLGSGGCLSEWKITSQAILSGFENLEIYLVDRDYAKDDSKQFPERFQQFFKKFPQVKVNTHILSSLEDFAKLDIACDVASAIDFDADTTKLPKIELKLSDKGFTFITRKLTPPNWKWNLTDKAHHLVSRINP